MDVMTAVSRCLRVTGLGYHLLWMKTEMMTQFSWLKIKCCYKKWWMKLKLKAKTNKFNPLADCLESRLSSVDFRNGIGIADPFRQHRQITKRAIVENITNSRQKIELSAISLRRYVTMINEEPILSASGRP